MLQMGSLPALAEQGSLGKIGLQRSMHTGRGKVWSWLTVSKGTCGRLSLCEEAACAPWGRGQQPKGPQSLLQPCPVSRAQVTDADGCLVVSSKPPQPPRAQQQETHCPPPEAAAPHPDCPGSLGTERGPPALLQ